MAECQAEVADVFALVDGFFHGAEHEFVDESLFGGALDLLEEFGKDGGLDMLGDREGIAEAGHHIGEVLHFFDVGALVDTVDEGDTLLVDVDGDGLVGSEHELLDEAVGLKADAIADLEDAPLLVEDDAGLGQVKIEGPFGESSFAQQLSKFAGDKEVVGDGARGLVGFAGVEEFLDLFVGKAGTGFDDGIPDLP